MCGWIRVSSSIESTAPAQVRPELGTVPLPPPVEPARPAGERLPAGLSPGRRAWLRFKRNRLGYWSLILFSVMVVVSLFAEVLSTDRPLVLRYEGRYYFPVVRDYSEKTFGGDF